MTAGRDDRRHGLAHSFADGMYEMLGAAIDVMVRIDLRPSDGETLIWCRGAAPSCGSDRVHAVENADAVDIDEIAPLRWGPARRAGRDGRYRALLMSSRPGELRLTLSDSACERIISTDVGGTASMFGSAIALDQFGSAAIRAGDNRRSEKTRQRFPVRCRRLRR